MKFPIQALALVLLAFATGCSTPSKAEVDAEVKRLCAIDGGIRVYEVVKLPADKFDERGDINFLRQTQKGNELGPDYIYKWDQRDLIRGVPTRDPSELAMTRGHLQISRKADGKLLGEVVRYTRAGGDFPGPWMPTSYHCPDAREASEPILLRQIFMRQQ